jgi:hypothetical protein
MLRRVSLGDDFDQILRHFQAAGVRDAEIGERVRM